MTTTRQSCNACDTVDYDGQLDDAGRCAQCVAQEREFVAYHGDDSTIVEPAHGDVPDGSIHSHAYDPMTFADGFGCKVCGRSVVSHANRGTLGAL